MALATEGADPVEWDRAPTSPDARDEGTEEDTP